MSAPDAGNRLAIRRWDDPPPSAAARWLRTVRWLLPLLLAGVALFFELNEHVLQERAEISPAFLGEIVVFAVIGPVIVAIVLGWVARLVAGYQATSAALSDANRDLEANVAERTRSLQATSEQLAAANRSLSVANDELRQLDRLKSEFVSLVSHQLRAPLTNINGALELVAEDADLLPPAHRRTLEILGVEGKRLSNLIQTILDVSRLEAGRLTPRLGAVAVEPLLVRACRSAMAAEGDRRWSVAISPALPPAWADETLLEEVLRALLDNAIHYSDARASVDVGAVAADGSILISVADHGRGIPAAQQEMIFRSFHRVDAGDATMDGYGLGLYFADRLTRAQGGTIQVESPLHADPERPGSRFTISMPIASDEPEDTRPKSVTSQAREEASA